MNKKRTSDVCTRACEIHELVLPRQTRAIRSSVANLDSAEAWFTQRVMVILNCSRFVRRRQIHYELIPPRRFA